MTSSTGDAASASASSGERAGGRGGRVSSLAGGQGLRINVPQDNGRPATPLGRKGSVAEDGARGGAAGVKLERLSRSGSSSSASALPAGPLPVLPEIIAPRFWVVGDRDRAKAAAVGGIGRILAGCGSEGGEDGGSGGGGEGGDVDVDVGGGESESSDEDTSDEAFDRRHTVRFNFAVLFRLYV